MKKGKREKGITLVALIITIVVLLILAVVSITTITNDDGILNYANNAVAIYNQGKANESATLQHYEDYLHNKGNLGDVRFVGTPETYSGLFSINGDDVIFVSATAENTTAELKVSGLKTFDATGGAYFTIKNFSTEKWKSVSITVTYSGDSRLSCHGNGESAILEPGEEHIFDIYIAVPMTEGLGTVADGTANIKITSIDYVVPEE